MMNRRTWFGQALAWVCGGVVAAYLKPSAVSPPPPDLPTDWHTSWCNAGGCAVWDEVLTDAEIACLSDGCAPHLIRPHALIQYRPLCEPGR